MIESLLYLILLTTQQAIEGTPSSLRACWSDHEITACFEPRSNTAVTNVFEDRFSALSIADQVLIGAVS